MTTSLIRRKACPSCGSHMVWTPNAWTRRAAPRKISPLGANTAKDAYACDNASCGAVLNPQLFPRTPRVVTGGSPAVGLDCPGSSPRDPALS
jgi:hypothetical protein